MRREKHFTATITDYRGTLNSDDIWSVNEILPFVGVHWAGVQMLFGWDNKQIDSQIRQSYLLSPYPLLKLFG